MNYDVKGTGALISYPLTATAENITLTSNMILEGGVLYCPTSDFTLIDFEDRERVVGLGVYYSIDTLSSKGELPFRVKGTPGNTLNIDLIFKPQ